MQILNLPEYKFRLKEEDNTVFILDKLRKKYLVLTPEEWVRQNIIQYLIHEKGFPAGLISSEAGLKVNMLKRRYDVLVYSKDRSPLMLVECKAPDVAITQKVIDQIVAYNSKILAPYMLISNGMQHFFLKRNNEGVFLFKPQLPEYNNM